MNRPYLFTKLLALFFFILIVTAHSASADTQTPQQIAKKVFPSVVLLIMEDANGQPMSLGSGFFVQEGVIASNLHVVKGATRGYAKIVGQGAKLNVEGIVGIDQERDLVLLKTLAPRIPYISLGNSDIVEVGEPIYAVGNPQGLEGTFSQGIVSSIRQADSDKLLQITSSISPGSSGGPVLNSKGEVVGVAVATFQGGQNLNFAIPSNYLKTLLNDLKPLTPLSKLDDSKKKRSILADFGNRSTEGAIGGQFIWVNPILSGITFPMHGAYTFSLTNQLRDSISNVYCLVVFYDQNNSPIDVDVIEYKGIIASGLAKRVSGKVDGSVQKLTTREGSVSPRTKVEFRILDFQLTE